MRAIPVLLPPKGAPNGTAFGLSYHSHNTTVLPRCHCQAALSPAAYAWYNAIRDEKRTAGAIALNSYRLMLRAQELYCAVALYGHTHVSEIEYAGGVQIVCPGSPSVPRRGRRKSFAKLEIENGSAVASIVAL